MAPGSTAGIATKCAQNTQNYGNQGRDSNYAYFAHTSLRVKTLIDELRSLGVMLSMEGDQLAFDAPAESLSGELLGKMRADREGLMRWVLARSTGSASGIVCPWCRSAELADDAKGIRCERCHRHAWLDGASSIVRADWVDADWR